MMARWDGKRKFGILEDIQKSGWPESSILNRWTGWQMINNDIPLDNETGVNLKSHQDDTDNYSWRKVSDPIDSGGWYTKSPVREFFGAGCERKRLYNCWGWPTYLIQD
jgi:hypothetical protein